MKLKPKKRKNFPVIFIITATAFSIPVFCNGCAKSESQLKTGITKTFDYASLPFKILTRQVDNGLDHIVKQD